MSRPNSIGNAQKNNRANSKDALKHLWGDEKNDFQEMVKDVKNFDHRISIGGFLASSIIVAICAAFSNHHGHKNILQLLSMGTIYTLGCLLIAIIFIFSVKTTMWGHRFYTHRKNSLQTDLIIDADYFLRRFKEDPQEIIYSFTIIIGFILWFSISELILNFPYLGEFIYWATK